MLIACPTQISEVRGVRSQTPLFCLIEYIAHLVVLSTESTYSFIKFSFISRLFMFKFGDKFLQKSLWFVFRVSFPKEP